MIPDVQAERSRIRRHLKKVGVRDVIVPLEESLGNFSVYTDLNPDVRGSHLSRLVESVQTFRGCSLNQLARYSPGVADRLHQSLGCAFSYIRCRTSWPSYSCSPVTQKSGYFTVKVQFDYIGSMQESPTCDWMVEVPITTACPCSLELVRHSGKEGIPHSQRGLARITVRTYIDTENVVVRVVNLVRRTLVTPFPVLKREDELQFALDLASRPMFVEDAARLLHERLDAEQSFLDFVAVVETFESIHPHNAVAVTCKGVADGLR